MKSGILWIDLRHHQGDGGVHTEGAGIVHKHSSCNPDGRSKAYGDFIFRRPQHQVHPLGQGERGAGPLVRQGRLAPLDPVSAHGTDDGAVCAEGPADGLDVVAVAAVKGIVLCDDTDCRHDPTSWVKKFEIRGFNACPFGQNGI